MKKGPELPPAFKAKDRTKQRSVSKVPKDAAHAVKQQGFYAYKMKAEMKIPEGDLAARTLAAGRKKKK